MRQYTPLSGIMQVTRKEKWWRIPHKNSTQTRVRKIVLRGGQPLSHPVLMSKLASGVLHAPCQVTSKNLSTSYSLLGGIKTLWICSIVSCMLGEFLNKSATTEMARYSSSPHLLQPVSFVHIADCCVLLFWKIQNSGTCSSVMSIVHWERLALVIIQTRNHFLLGTHPLGQGRWLLGPCQ